VTETVPQLTGVPTVVAAHASDVGVTEATPAVPMPVTATAGPAPPAVSTVTVALSVATLCGVKVIGPLVQVWSAFNVRPPVQVPAGMVKSVESLLTKGVAASVTAPF